MDSASSIVAVLAAGAIGSKNVGDARVYLSTDRGRTFAESLVQAGPDRIYCPIEMALHARTVLISAGCARNTQLIVRAEVP